MEDLHPDLLSCLLSRLDGPSLASVASSSALLRRLAADPQLWEAACHRAWPSLRRHRPRCFRSFFRDAHAYPFLLSPEAAPPVTARPLLWAVDLAHDGKIVLSRVVEIAGRKPGFLGLPLRVNLAGDGAAVSDPETAELSWLVFEPESQRAVNLSSRLPVLVKRDWHTDELRLRFAVVIGCSAATATAVYDGGVLKEVSLTVEDEDGRCMTGRRSLALLHGALHGGRKGNAVVEARQQYAEYMLRKKARKGRQSSGETRMNLFCTISGLLLFAAFLLLPLQINMISKLH